MYNHIPAYTKDLERVTSEPLPWDRLDGTSVLIAGANGLIASFFVDCLMYRNKTKGSRIAVYALCRNSEKAENLFRAYRNDECFHLIIQDVCEPMKYDKHFDYIIHAASNAHPLAFAEFPVETMKANILGSINLLEYAAIHKPKKFLFLSSVEVYGQNDSGDHGLKEDYSGYIDCTNIRAAYPESKRISETLCISYHKQYGVNTVIARPAYIYGPTMTEDSTKADAQFIRNALAGEDIVMKSAGTQRRSYCYVSDMASAILYLMLYGENANAYNVANQNSSVTIREFAETLASLAKVNVIYENPDDIERLGYSPMDNGVLNSGKLDELGWRAKVLLYDGLRNVIEIMKSKEKV